MPHIGPGAEHGLRMIKGALDLNLLSSNLIAALSIERLVMSGSFFVKKVYVAAGCDEFPAQYMSTEAFRRLSGARGMHPQLCGLVPTLCMPPKGDSAVIEINRILNCTSVTCFAVLGVAENANYDVGRKAYLHLAKMIHPDKNGNTQAANDAMTILTDAYENFERRCMSGASCNDEATVAESNADAQRKRKVNRRRKELPPAKKTKKGKAITATSKKYASRFLDMEAQDSDTERNEERNDETCSDTSGKDSFIKDTSSSSASSHDSEIEDPVAQNEVDRILKYPLQKHKSILRLSKYSTADQGLAAYHKIASILQPSLQKKQSSSR